MKRTVPEAEALRTPAALIERVERGDEVIIERDGAPVAVVVAATTYGDLERLRQERRDRAWAWVEAVQAANEGLSEDEAMSLALEAVREVREEERHKASA